MLSVSSDESKGFTFHAVVRSRISYLSYHMDLGKVCGIHTKIGTAVEHHLADRDTRTDDRCNRTTDHRT